METEPGSLRFIREPALEIEVEAVSLVLSTRLAVLADRAGIARLGNLTGRVRVKGATPFPNKSRDSSESFREFLSMTAEGSSNLSYSGCSDIELSE